MAVLLGLATLLSTLLGGMFALKHRDHLHLILGFSAGAVMGVAFFDLLPEAFNLATKHYDVSTVTSIVAVGFLLFMVVSRFMTLHPHVTHSEHPREAERGTGILGAGSLCIHSFLDGVGIGLAFKVSPSVGAVVAAAVLAHDFSDGINTVSIILRSESNRTQAFRWLVVDALAPLLGVSSTFFFTLPEAQLGLVLALFCGFFLYLGASDLLPESQHEHPQVVTSLMTVSGALVIYLAVHLSSR